MIAAIDTPFAGLTPDAVLDAAEALGLAPDGRLFALNSYENRVYRLGRLDAEPVVLKFYRAARWSDAQILEEHALAAELAAAELPVAAPLSQAGATLHHHGNFRLAAFPLCPGTAPDLDQPGARELLGRTLARVHAIGARRRFLKRQTLDASVARRARDTLLASPLLPEHMRSAYLQTSTLLLEGIEAAFQAAAPVPGIRLHGDCHLGNILWQATGPLFVDLDDCMNGPRIQDLWMFLSGTEADQQRQWREIMDGYDQFGSVEFRELALIEALRSIRMLHHAAWIAARWADPAFPRAFPWAGEARYWEGYVGDLRVQCEQVADPPRVS
ncbi:MAG TPA: serine/threonine protein kinase [Steroidobacteraceae bacterium]|jgi:Ser/Thr protein kinase RdoA (MazF antagonist)|nr:serine/threonine protein kinase [Steroidobacteraceae bacterium]